LGEPARRPGDREDPQSREDQEPEPKHAPRSRGRQTTAPVCQMAKPATDTAIATPIASRQGSGAPVAPRSATAERSAASGGIRGRRGAGGRRRGGRSRRRLPCPRRSAGQEMKNSMSIGSTPRKSGGERQLDRDAEQPADQGPGDAESESLEEIDGEALPRAGPEAAQDRDRRHLLADVGVERARDSDPAEDERHEPDEAQESVQVRDRLAKVALALGDGLERKGGPAGTSPSSSLTTASASAAGGSGPWRGTGREPGFRPALSRQGRPSGCRRGVPSWRRRATRRGPSSRSR
jgi:hypothetical protein